MSKLTEIISSLGTYNTSGTGGSSGQTNTAPSGGKSSVSKGGSGNALYDALEESIKKYNTPELNGTNGWTYNGEQKAETPQATVTPQATTGKEAEKAQQEEMWGDVLANDATGASSYVTGNTLFDQWKSDYSKKTEAERQANLETKAAAEKEYEEFVERQREINGESGETQEGENGEREYNPLLAAALQPYTAKDNPNYAGVMTAPATTAIADDAAARAQEQQRQAQIAELQEQLDDALRGAETAKNAYNRFSNNGANANDSAVQTMKEAQRAAEAKVSGLQRQIAALGGEANMELPSFGERVWNTVKGAAESAGAAYTNTLGTLYAGGANAQGQVNSEIFEQKQKEYDREAAFFKEQCESYGYNSEDVDKAYSDWWDQMAAGIPEAERTVPNPEELYPQAKNDWNVLNSYKIQMNAYGTAASGIAQEGTKQNIYDAADTLQQKSAEDIQEAKRGTTGAESFLIDVGNQAVQMGADAAANAIAPGAGTISMAARSFGSGAQEARQNGADEGKAFLYGISNAALELGTEKMFDGLAGIYGKGAADDIVEGVITKLANTDAGKNALRYIANSTGEGAEEFVSDAVQPILQRLTYDEHALDNYGGDIEQWLYDGLVGAAMGGIGGAVDIVNGEYAAKNAAIKNKSGVKAQEATAQNTESSLPQAEATVPTAEQETTAVGQPLSQQADSSPYTGEPLKAETPTAQAETVPEQATQTQEQGTVPEQGTQAESAQQTQQQSETAKSAEDYLLENVPGQKNNASETETGNTSETVAVDSDGNIIKINGGEKANLTSLSSVDDTGTFSPQGTPTQGVNAETVVSDTNVPENGGNVKSESGLSERAAKGIEYAANPFGVNDDSIAAAVSDSSGRKYIIAGGLVFAVTDDAYNHASENPTGTIPGVTVEKKEAPIKMLDKYAADEYQKVTEPPIEATASNGVNAIVFKKANGKNVYFNAEYISALDGAEFYIETNRKQPQIKAVDENGNLIGYALPMNVSIDESTIKPTNLKAFANDANNVSEATSVQEGVNTRANAESANSGQNTALNSNDTQTAPKTGADALFETVQGTQTETGDATIPQSADADSSLYTREPLNGEQGTQTAQGTQTQEQQQTAQGTQTQGTQEQGTAQGAQQGAQSDVGEPMKPTYNKDAPPANGEKYSQFWENTLRRNEEAAGTPEDVQKPLSYMPISEKESLARASGRLSADRQGEVETLIKSEAWSGVQVDMSWQIASELYADAKKTGNYEAYTAWRKVMQEHTTAGAQGLQAQAKYTRHSGDNALKAVSDKLADSNLTDEQKTAVINKVGEYAAKLDEIRERVQAEKAEAESGTAKPAEDYLAENVTGQKNNASEAETGKAYAKPYSKESAASIRKDAKKFRNIVAGIDTSVRDFFKKWSGGRKSHEGEKLEKLYLGKITDKARAKISELLGYDVTSTDYILTNDGVKHILDEHGNAETELKHGNVPLSDEILESLPDVLANPDDIQLGHTETRGERTGIVFIKNLPDGTVVYIQFDNSGRGTIEGKTLYAKPAPTSGVNADNATNTFTPKTAEPDGSDTNIPADGQNVKSDKDNGEKLAKILLAGKKNGLEEQVNRGNLKTDKDLTDLIEGIANVRNTSTFRKSLFGRLLRQQDTDYLLDYAYNQIVAFGNDAVSHRKEMIPAKVKAYQVLAHLTSIPTFLRNIGGNATFNPIDMFAQNGAGVIIDSLVSKATGKRTVSIDKGLFSPTARRMAKEAMQKSILEVAGDVDMGSTNRYGDVSGRQFKMSGTKLEQFFSRWQQLIGYSLTTSDQWFKGKVEGEQFQGLNKLINEGKTETTPEEAMELAHEMALYRTFQNNGIASKASKATHDFLNLLGFGGKVDNTKLPTRQGGFGLGDLMNPYPGVPASLGVKALEFSPANIVKGGIELANLIADMKTNVVDVKRQQQAVMDIARGVSGIPLLAIAAAATKWGLIKNWDDEEDKDVKALNAAEGKTGIQINFSAIGRWLKGEENAMEWRDDDALESVGWLEPLNAFLAIGSLIAMEGDDANIWDYAGDTAEGSIQALLELPVMDNISDLIDTMSYSDAENWLDKAEEGAIQYAGSTINGFNPSPVRNLAKALDDTYRDTYGDTAAETAVNTLLAGIPGLRETLPAKLDNFGNEKKYNGDLLERLYNTMLNPGDRNKIRQHDASETLEDVREAAEDADIYPDRYAPYSITVGSGDEKQTYSLTKEQQREYQKIAGGISETYINELADSEVFDDLTPEQQAEVIKQINSYAKEQAKANFLEGAGADYEASYGLEGSLNDPVQYLTDNVRISDFLEENDATLSATERVKYYAKSGEYSISDLEKIAEDKLGASQNYTFSGLVRSFGAEAANIYAKVDSGKKAAYIGSDLMKAMKNKTDDEKLDALKYYLPADKNGKAQATVRRYEAAKKSGIGFNDWARIESTCKDILEEKSAATGKNYSTVGKGIAEEAAARLSAETGRTFDYELVYDIYNELASDPAYANQQGETYERTANEGKAAATGNSLWNALY